MCGVLGCFSDTYQIDAECFNRSLELINHRGPDDTGFVRHKTHLTAFQGFKRLSILDLSKAGHQPMTFKNLTITFNGEVYNFKEIRSELESFGYSFSSNSDTEVIIKSFHNWGYDAVNKFNGMFAIAVFNSESKELAIFRDRVGIKPLYYYWDEKIFCYASEVKPILALSNIDKSLSDKNLVTYLSYGYIPSPETIFSKIQSVEPGSFLIFKEKKLTKHYYWNLINQFKNSELLNVSFSEIKEELKNLLHSSVNYRMISDVPIGAFLSGGIDSTLVASIMQANSSKPINTFSIGFDDEKYNEAAFAKEISQIIGSNHHEQYVSAKDTKMLLPEMIASLDLPFGDSSALPMMVVSKLAKKHVTVALSGDGGDELYCGYRLYDQAKSFQRFQLLSGLMKPVRHSVFRSFYKSSKYKYLPFLFLGDDNQLLNSGALVNQNYLFNLSKIERHAINSQFFLRDYYTNNIQMKNMLLNMKTYLPDDILKKVDLATMHYSLEARVPLLDHRLVEFSFRIPHKYKYQNGVKKYILKEVLYDFVPKNLMDRPKKGFSIPVFNWLRDDLNYLIQDYVLHPQSVGFEEYGIDTKRLVSIFNNYPKNYFTNTLIWNLLVYRIWKQENKL